MLKYLIPAAIACAVAAPALAQNDAEPVPGRTTEFSDAPVAVPPSRAVVFTAIGTYADLSAARLIDVRVGDTDTGVLRVTCNGGDLLTGVFTPGATAAANKAKIVKAPDSSPLAAGKNVRARWTGTPSGTDKPVALSAGQAAVCAGLG